MKFNIRNALAYGYASMLIVLGFVRRAVKRGLAGEYILSLYFHAPGKNLFQSIVEWLLKRGFHFISAAELEQIARGIKPFPKGAVLLTVDDGWRTNGENIVSVANKYRIPVTIFVSSGPVTHGTFWWSYFNQANLRNPGSYNIENIKKLPNRQREEALDEVKMHVVVERQALTPDELREIALSPFVTIGGHTVSHPILPNCDDHESLNEIKNNREQLEAWVKKPVQYFAFPNGSYSPREITYLQIHDFGLAFSTRESYLKPESLQQRYLLPRFYIFETASLRENICRMTGVWSNHFFKKGAK